MSYAEQAAEHLAAYQAIPAQADAEIATIQADYAAEIAILDAELLAAKDATGRVTAELALAQATIAEQDATITEQVDTIVRLRHTIAKLKAQLPQPTREPLFGAKPGRTPLDPKRVNSETEYAKSQTRAGTEYRIHRHYANSWAEAQAKTTACTADLCAITVSPMTSSHAFDVNPAKIAALPDRPIALGIHHEPEDDIDTGIITLAAWLDAQAEGRVALGPINAMRSNAILLGGTLMGFTWRGANPRHTAESLYPGDGVWDHLGTDVYPSIINAGAQFIPPSQLLGHEVAFGQAHGLDVCVFEWGITTDQPGRADYIRSINQYARDNQFLAVSYWDHGDCYLRNDDEFAAAGGF